MSFNVLISLQNIVKEVQVGDSILNILDNINLDIRKGEFVAIVGQSGSGKSSLLNILGCLDTPSQGIYKLEGSDIAQASSGKFPYFRREKFGFIFQRYHLVKSLTALENVALPAIYSRKPKVERLGQAKLLLERLGLADKLDKFPNTLSGGQQQRVSIARSLVNGGEIILADEPTGALDSKNGENILSILRELNDAGHTIILATHDKDIATRANRIVEMRDGMIISDSSRISCALPVSLPSRERKNLSGVFLHVQVMEAFHMALQTLTSHKMRSILTMLGVIIGVAAVISMLALGTGAQEKIIADINSMGTNTIEIYPGTGFGDLEAWSKNSLRIEDVNLLNRQPFLVGGSPVAIHMGLISSRFHNATGQAYGVNEQYFQIKGLVLKQGRLFTEAEIQRIASVVVLDKDSAETFFPNIDPVGQFLIFEKQPLQVIGIVESNNRMSGSGVLAIWIPHLTLIYKLSGVQRLDSVVVQVSDEDNPQIVEKVITEILTTRHDGQKDFFILNMDSLRRTVENTTDTLRILIFGIAMVSLLVGGIGVMNIMLVSVTERIHEIGIRSAVGARQKDIRIQFLIEAVVLCSIGGIIGVLLALFVGLIVKNLAQGVFLIFTPWSFVLAIVFSMTIGIIFGFMPAHRAANLSPVQALMQE